MITEGREDHLEINGCKTEGALQYLIHTKTLRQATLRDLFILVTHHAQTQVGEVKEDTKDNDRYCDRQDIFPGEEARLF